ncbi:MAG: ABC transporter permease [Hyphomicrobiales bacterium]
MLIYVAKRIAVWVPSIFLILLAVYALAFFGGGDPIRLIFLRAPGDVAYDPARIAAIREDAGLNRPFIIQYLSYLGNLFQGDWGNSLVSGRSVRKMIVAAMPVSMQLGLATIVVTAIVAIPLGVYAALRQNSAIDRVIVTSSLFLWAIPPYVAGPLLMVAVIVILPTGGVPFGWGGVFDIRVVLPLTVLAFQPIALIVRQTRAAVIEVLNEDFVRTAHAKGLPSRVIVFKHILRPVLTPVVTQLGLIMITIINGAIFVELVFGLPGLGRLTVESTINADYPVILAITLIGAVLVMTANLFVDVIYPLLDPRARAGGR